MGVINQSINHVSQYEVYIHVMNIYSVAIPEYKRLRHYTECDVAKQSCYIY